MRKKRPIERSEGLKRDASLVVIASEDQYAVKQYFELFHSTRIQFRVLETTHGESAPAHVMERLAAFMSEYSFGEGDQFWFVGDTDHWIESNHIHNLVEIVKLCRDRQIGVALSNPCFDLWLLLHFAEFPSEESLTCQEVGGRIRSVVGQFNKTRVYDLPIGMSHIKRAVDSSKANQFIGGEIPTQPQTSVHQIIDDLIARRMIDVKSA